MKKYQKWAFFGFFFLFVKENHVSILFTLFLLKKKFCNSVNFNLFFLFSSHKSDKLFGIKKYEFICLNIQLFYEGKWTFVRICHKDKYASGQHLLLYEYLSLAPSAAWGSVQISYQIQNKSFKNRICCYKCQ